MKKLFLFLSLISLPVLCFSKNNEWSFRTSSDFAYSFSSDFISGDSHFSKVTNVYGGIAGRINGIANYTLPIPLGQNWLVADSSLFFEPSFEISPITFQLKFQTTFEPVPFYQISLGGSFGSGWNFGDVMGLKVYDSNINNYVNLTFGKNNYYSLWLENILQFDTGAIFPGDWTHVIFQLKTKLYYEGITGLSRNQIFAWQENKNLCSCLKYNNIYIVGYQMPFTLYRTGFMFEFTGNLNLENNNLYSKNYNEKFTKISISPFAQFKFSENDILGCKVEFSNRRSFLESHSKEEQELLLTYCGTEWFLYRIGLNWEHWF